MKGAAILFPALLAAPEIFAQAATATAPVATTAAASTSPGNMLQVMVGLMVVLGLLIAVAWSMKKMGAGKHAAAGALKIVGGVSVGNRERILVVEVADQWIVVGVTPTSISALSTMPKQEGIELSPVAPLAKNFSDWLKQTIDKRKTDQLRSASNTSGTDNAH
ncbi:flagellar biosynthetic protein FliO [Actimicrobium sp. CCI2.3]|uniref:flagellar biosynthetic protein FliO n=1 Tax=Actimicrobium sp. CCI2.3 TaxID=3048616 RepID=UPI002AB3A91D|nr:flagellar biosynthetic protein FliO [Actimicrobium sp. CCI2.3]MDY7575009.1 flagellar biosynthetic protein FliO [Actimicrobium sp. CCI2.3]MEB0021420.1 flagellar biosynthetic protein FliO [Actimicrobium sp. CCI2.3]